ncbi:epoxide hydrolase, partial [Tanacetum coccineum]
NLELTAPWTGIQIKVPVIYVVGEKDPVYTTPGAKTYIHSGMCKKDVPLLQQVLKDTHAVNQGNNKGDNTSRSSSSNSLSTYSSSSDSDSDSSSEDGPDHRV